MFRKTVRVIADRSFGPPGGHPQEINGAIVRGGGGSESDEWDGIDGETPDIHEEDRIINSDDEYVNYNGSDSEEGDVAGAGPVRLSPFKYIIPLTRFFSYLTEIASLSKAARIIGSHGLHGR